MIEPIKPIAPEAKSTGPEIRELTPEEIQTLAPDFGEHGLPDPATSTAVGIIENGQIVGYQFLQLKLHVQPTKLLDGHSHMFTQLCRKSEEIILAKVGPVWAYVFATPGRMAALAESRGCTVEPWVVLSKLIAPRIPAAPVLEMLPIVEPASPVTTEELHYPGIDLSEVPAEGAIQ